MILGASFRAIKESHKENTRKRAFITLTELRTLAVEVEAILNERSIIYVSSDVGDEEPLTPSHLLYGRRITPLPYPEVEDEMTYPTSDDDSDLRQS